MNLLQGLGQAKPVSEFINTAGQYQQTQSALETQRLQQQKLQAENAQREKDVKEYDPEAVISLYPKEHQDIIRQTWKEAGVIDPTSGMIQGQNIRKTPELVQNNEKMQTALLTGQFQKLAKENASLSSKQDPESQAKMMANLEAMTQLTKASRFGKDKLAPMSVAKGAKLYDPNTSSWVTPPDGADTPEVDMSKTPLGQINTANGMEYVYPSSDGTTAMLSGGDTYNPQFHGPMQKFGSDPKTVDAIWMESARVLKDPNATPEERAKATQDIETAKEIMKTRGEDRFAGLHGEMMIGTTTEGIPVYKDTRQAGAPAFTFGINGEKKTYSGVIAQKSEALPLSGGAPAERSATYKADRASLAKLTVGADSIMAFKKGVSGSLDLVDKLQEKFSRTTISGVNKLSQWIQYNAGDPDVKAFRNATTTAMTEYMKVTTAGMGLSAQELTQMAQTRAKTLLDIVDNRETFKRSISVMHQEMDIKERAFKAQRAEIQQRLGGAAGGSGSDPLELGL